MALQGEKPDIPRVGNATGSKPVLDEAVGAGNVDKIRDILFGSQMRDYELKFSRLENRMMNEVSRLREESNNRLDALEGYINREAESLIGQLKAEQIARTETQNDLADKVSGKNQLLEKRLAELSNQMGSSARELRQQILDQSGMLSEEISSSYEKTNNALDRTAGELREEKLDRSALSSLLAGLALQLSEDSMPDVDQNKDTD